MFTRLLAVLNRRRYGACSPRHLLAAFFRRFAGRTILVHDGLDREWMRELLTVGGGGGHFRFDIRQSQSQPPSPLDWVIRRHVLALGLPLPLLLKVGQETIWVRHLTRRGAICHPADIAWMLDEIERRFHATLRPEADDLHVEAGLPPQDNDIELPGTNGSI